VHAYGEEKNTTNEYLYRKNVISGKKPWIFVKNADFDRKFFVKTVSLAVKLVQKAVAIYVNGCIIILDQTLRMLSRRKIQ